MPQKILLGPPRPAKKFSSGIFIRVFRAIIRALVYVIEFIVDLMDTFVYRILRIVLTGLLIWWAVKHIHFESINTESFIGIADRVGYLKAAGLAVACAMVMSFLWSGSLCDGAAGLLLQMIDSPDNRPFEEDRMRKVERLIQQGKKRRAIRLCKRMLRRRQGSRMVLETLISRLSTE